VKNEGGGDPPERDPRADAAEDPGSEPPGSGLERRRSGRFDVTWQVDCETEDTFLYAYITNISEMGIFVKTDKLLPVGSHLVLRFAPPSSRETFVLSGIVQWLNPLRPLGDNPNPGMGIRFQALKPDDRERLVQAVRTIAYVRQSENN
jgi:type IV pilus assembly protein PilZ